MLLIGRLPRVCTGNCTSISKATPAGIVPLTLKALFNAGICPDDKTMKAFLFACCDRWLSSLFHLLFFRFDKVSLTHYVN